MSHPLSPFRNRRRAFTLVELMVVIAIISLLMAVLLPALQSARTAAQATVSQSNLRQITLAIHMYSADSKHVLPFTVWADAPTNAHFWPTRITGIRSTASPTAVTGPQYLSNLHVFWSPGRKQPFGGHPDAPAKVNWGFVGYGANHYGAMFESATVALPFKLDRANNPPASKHLLLAESFRPGNDVDGRYDLHRNTAGIFSYKNAAVRSYVDGHVAYRDPLDIRWKVTGPHGRQGEWITPNNESDRNGEPYYRNAVP